MKQITCFYSICLATSLVFGGCQKENVQKKPAGLGTISVQKTGLDCCDDIQTVCNGSILRFNSIAHYDSVVACLDEAYDDWNDGYFAQYSPSDYTSDQMDSIDDAIGFVEEQPLDDFNTCMNFYSLRQHQNKLEDGWLDSTNMDTLQDPDIYFTEEDEVEATLYNKWSEIAIADTIYKLLPDGDVLMIFNFDCAAVMQLRDDPNYRCENVTILPIGSSDQCKAKKRLRCYDYYDGNKRMKSIHKHKIGFRFGEVAKTIHYKKKWGIWKRKRGDIRVRMTGFAYDMGCNLYTADQISETKGWDVRRKVKIRYKSSAHNWFKVENQVNYTVHEARLGQPPFQYGISRTVVLFW